MNVIIDGAAGCFITDQSATFTAVRYGLGPAGTPVDGKPCFNLGDGWGRTIAAQRVLKVELDQVGLHLTFTDGYRALVPLASCRPSWRY